MSLRIRLSLEFPLLLCVMGVNNNSNSNVSYCDQKCRTVDVAGAGKLDGCAWTRTRHQMLLGGNQRGSFYGMGALL